MTNSEVMRDLVTLHFEIGDDHYTRAFDLTELQGSPLAPLAMAGSMPVQGYERLFAIDEFGRAWVEDMDSSVMLGVSQIVMHFMLEYGPPQLRSWYAELCHRNRKNK